MDDTEKLVTALDRIADEISAHLAWMREQKQAENAKAYRLPPNEYKPSPLLAGQWPRRDGNIYGNVKNADPPPGDL